MTEPATGWSAPSGEPSTGAAAPDGPAPYGPASSAPPTYGPPPAAASWFSPPPVSGLGVAALATGGLYVVTTVAQAVLAFPAREEAQAFEVGAATAGFGGATLVGWAALVVTWVLGSLWLARIHRAAFLVAPTQLRRSVAWTWLGWVVPVVLLWFPKQIVDDLWRVAAAQPGRQARGTTGGWWFWWIMVTFFNGIAARLGPQGDGFAGFAVFSALVVSVAYLFWFRVVRGLSAAHDAGPWTKDAPVPPRPTP